MLSTYSFPKTIPTLASVIFAALLAAGCSSPCDTIVSKMNECNGTDLEPNPNCPDELYDCQAECYENASCDEIKTNAAPFSSCVSSCGQS
jgi:hypothetical protein